jgi:hypothetical protein
VADELSDIRRNAVACPEPNCKAQEGDLSCYTATGFPRGWHASRRRLALGRPDPAKKAPSPDVRPSHKQADMLAWAIANDGRYEVSGYTFHGDAQKRAAMDSMVGRTWFRRLHHTDHGTLYEITDEGRQASGRYERWMSGDPK